MIFIFLFETRDTLISNNTRVRALTTKTTPMPPLWTTINHFTTISRPSHDHWTTITGGWGGVPPNRAFHFFAFKVYRITKNKKKIKNNKNIPLLMLVE